MHVCVDRVHVDTCACGHISMCVDTCVHMCMHVLWICMHTRTSTHAEERANRIHNTMPRITGLQMCLLTLLFVFNIRTVTALLAEAPVEGLSLGWEASVNSSTETR